LKAVMYHYVRPQSGGLPYFPYLRLADFERQLDFFARNHGFVSRDGFLKWRDGSSPAPQGILLTFDDGLNDHLEHVLPVLRRRNLFGLFYVTSGPPLTGQLLDVHKVHLALGRLGGEAALVWLKESAPDLLGPDVSDDAASHYAAQTSDEATRFIKHLFNWKLSPAERRVALDGLFRHAFGGRPPDWRSIYLDDSGVRTLTEAGMGVGAHGHSHFIPAHLPVAEQRAEVTISCDYVDRAGGSRAWGYCYPYGSADAISEEVREAVAAAGCPLAFAVEPADIDAAIASTPRYALPRHNCNMFPCGSVSFDRRG
jgi:peptidoglycan/xylan/chitin deacetylase (PgdA/CDA1 family)